MKVSDFIALFLEKKGITHVFELSGGMITHILDSLNQKTSIRVVTMHHEQSASFAADSFGRIRNIPGIALATSGPGATNLLTGIGNCYFDSCPAIFITGQVNRHERKGDRNIRQLGFQETDICKMAEPITKFCFSVENPEDLPSILEKAFIISVEGRPGPVLIDIPMDIQRALLSQTFSEQSYHDQDLNNNYFEIEKFYDSYEDRRLHINLMIDQIKNSKRPLILAGRGISASRSRDYFNQFYKFTNIPVVTSLLGIDLIEYDDPNRVGFIGSYGNRWANIALGECDLLIVLGSRLDIRQTGADTNFFSDRKIFHIDCERGEVNNRISGCTPIITDLKIFFHDFFEVCSIANFTFEMRSEWINYINNQKSIWPDTSELSVEGINPNVFIHKLSKSSKLCGAFLADVGAHQMWTAQSLEISKGQLFLTSGGMGAMGYSLPAAIGASIALDKQVICIVGDGCMQINIQELQTIYRNQIPVKIVVMNNQNLGMIRQFQDSYFNSRYQSTWWGYSAPSFEKIGKAYGIKSMTIEKEEEIENAIKWMWDGENENKPILLQVMINPYTNTYPKIAFGKPITEMEPFSKPIGMEST